MNEIVRGPQSPDDSRQVPRTIDENGVIQFGQVGFQELDFSAVFGVKATSPSLNSIGYGVKTFTIDQAEHLNKFYPGLGVQAIAEDRDCFMYGVVTAVATTSEPFQVEIVVTNISALTGDFSNWEIQIVSNAAADAALLAFSSTSFAMTTGSKTFTIQSGKFFPVGSSVFGTALASPTEHFAGIVTAYSGTSLTIFVTSVTSSNTFDSWSIYDTSGILINTVNLATSTSAVLINTTAQPKAFTVQSGLTIQSGDLLWAVDTANSSNFIFGQVSLYAGTTLHITPFSVGGSGTISSWYILPALGKLGGDTFGMSQVNISNNQFSIMDSGFAITLILNGRSGADRTLTVDVDGANRNINLSSNLTIPADPNADRIWFWDDSAGAHAYLAPDSTLTISGTTLSVTTAAPSAATQAEQEAASVTNAYTTPGRQLYHPAHPKAIYSATVTPTAVAAAASVDTATEIITWAAAHGIPDGTCIWPSSATPGGATVNTAYYFHTLSPTTGTLHLTLANALAGTSAVNLTSSTAMVSRQLVYSSAFSYGMAASAPVAYVVGGTPIGLEFNISPALSAAAGLADLSFTGIVASTTAVADNTSSTPFPSGMTTSVITFDNASLTIVDAADGLPSIPTTIQTQAVTAFKVQFKLWGDQ